tara:strand:+ start:224 stop:805 length:582 start_codon:yes stop_codon:yes gene_type:complete
MKVIGLTGGIGSGKTSLLPVFDEENIPIFNADQIAKQLQNNELKDAISAQFGSGIFKEGVLDRKQLASIVFKDQAQLKILNRLVHPAVANAFENFKKMHQEAKLVVKEAAILFETGAAENCDYTILVTADENNRIDRIMKRDEGLSKEKIKARMAQQWPDEKKVLLADFIVINENLNEAKRNLRKIISYLKSL